MAGMSSAGPSPLRRLREAAGLSQQEVARRAGMSVRALRYLENGGVNRPQAASINRWAQALGVPAEELARRFAAGPAARETGAPGVRVEALGPLAVRRGGDEVPLGSAMRRLLLGLLAVQAGRPVGIEEIIDTLWPADPPPTCRQLVHTYISALRRLLADAGAIRVGPDGYRLELGEDGVDVVEFERLSTQGHAAVHARTLDSAAQLLGEAWALWRGPLPAGEPRLSQHPAAVRLVRQRAESVPAWAHRDIGDLDVAHTHATEALRLARKSGDRRFEAAALCLLGTVHARLGQVSDALACRAQGLEAVAELAEPRLEADGHLAAADTSLVLGLTQDALLHLDNARFLARQIGSGQLERRCDLLTRRIEMAGETAG